MRIFLTTSAIILSNIVFAGYPWYFYQHGINIAHDHGIFGDDVRIAILDTPIHPTHPVLRDSRVQENYCAERAKECIASVDHGTAVTSIIGATRNDAFPDFVGIAPHATIATFGVPKKNCDVTITEEALLQIKRFKPHIITISSNVLNLSDASLERIIEEMVDENPSLVIVVAAGNDGAALGHADLPCRPMSDLNANTQANLEQLATHRLKHNFVLVGNLARNADISFDDVMLVQNDEAARVHDGERISKRHYALRQRIRASEAAHIVKTYSSTLNSKDYLSGFFAFHTHLLTEKYARADENTLLFYAGIHEIPSDAFIEHEVWLDAKIGDYEDNAQRISSEISAKLSMRNIKRNLLVKSLKATMGREAMSKEIANLELRDNDALHAVRNLFVGGLPLNNASLIELAKDFVPFGFDESIALNPSSARAGALNDMFISAFGTNIPAASFEYDEKDSENKHPTYIVKNHTGTSFSAPIVTGAIALVAQACGQTPKNALATIFENARLHNSFWIFGHGMLDIKTIINRCTAQSHAQKNVTSEQ